jgi:hypothetical protein
MSKRGLAVCVSILAIVAARPLAAATRFDTNSDGRADLCWKNVNTNNTYVYQMNGTAISYEGWMNLNGSPFTSLADFNGDGRTDVLNHQSSAGVGQVTFLNTISMSAGHGPAFDTTPPDWVVLGSGDFNADGRADILFRNQVSGLAYMFFFGSNGGKQSESPWKYFTDANWQVAGIGDFDGDLRADVLWHNTSTGQNYLFFMNGATATSEGITKTTPDLNWAPQGIGDLDGDGKTDIVWRNTSTGQNYIFLMDGLTVKDEGPLNFVPDLNWSIAAVADYDGDGRADIFMRNFTTGENFFYMMAPGGLASDSRSGPVKSVNTDWAFYGSK